MGKRVPTVGADRDDWGNVLNAYLRVSLDATGRADHKADHEASGTDEISRLRTLKVDQDATFVSNVIFGTGSLINAGVFEVGTDLLWSSFKVNTDATLVSGVVLGTDSNILRYKIGTYEGDGAQGPTGLAITGVGFQVRRVKIYPKLADNLDTFLCLKNEQDATSFTEIHSCVASAEHFYIREYIISLDADGFTVGDVGSDSHPNKSGQTYIYEAWG